MYCNCAAWWPMITIKSIKTTHRQHQRPACAAYDTLRWSQTRVHPAHSTRPPSGSPRSRAPGPHPWPAAADPCHRRRTCRGNARRTCERKTNRKFSEVRDQRRLVLLVGSAHNSIIYTYLQHDTCRKSISKPSHPMPTCHRWVRPADCCQQSLAC